MRVPSENDHLAARTVEHRGVAAMTAVGAPVSSKTRSPGARSPIVRQPSGVGIGVSRASAFPSRRATRSSGSSTHSSVWPSTNSPGCRMNGSSSSTVEQLGQVRLGRPHVDERVAVVAEDPEAAVEVEVDRRRLEVVRVVRVDADGPGLERGPDVAVGQDAHCRLRPERCRAIVCRAPRTACRPRA